MIERFQCIPRKFNRRKFLKGASFTASSLTAGMLATRTAKAFVGSPFTFVHVPDPQYLADSTTCSGATVYNSLVNWCVANQNLSVNGVPLNIKILLQVGDCVNTADDTTQVGPQTLAVNAYKQATDNGIMVVYCGGNHDYDVGGVATRIPGYMWRDDAGKTGSWSATAVASRYAGGFDIGGGDRGYFIGVYSDPTFTTSTFNAAYRATVQGQNFLFIVVEYWPRDAVMTWAKTVHDAYPDHICMLLTHGYQDNSGARAGRGNDAHGNNYGPTTSGYPTSTDGCSGDEMWTGHLSTWDRLQEVRCGHWIDGYVSPASNWWVYQMLTSTGSAGQSVYQTFCNCQGNGGTTGDQINYCSSNPTTPNGTSDTMHLQLSRYTPATRKMESFLLSVNSGKWLGGATGTNALTVNNASPVQINNLDYPLNQGTNRFVISQ